MVKDSNYINASMPRETFGPLLDRIRKSNPYVTNDSKAVQHALSEYGRILERRERAELEERASSIIAHSLSKQVKDMTAEELQQLVKSTIDTYQGIEAAPSPGGFTKDFNKKLKKKNVATSIYSPNALRHDERSSGCV